jgi:hypothetical protein
MDFFALGSVIDASSLLASQLSCETRVDAFKKFLPATIIGDAFYLTNPQSPLRPPK